MSPPPLVACWRACLRNRRAATAIEYGLLCALLALAVLAGLRTLSGATVGQLNNVQTSVNASTR